MIDSDNSSPRLPENVPGPWFVNDECICCELCGELAPEIFKPLYDFSFHVVHHQPSNNEEESLAKEAAENCPAEAIQKTAMQPA